MKRDLLVIGASAVALNVAEIAHELGLRIEAFVDETLPKASPIPDFDRTVSNTLEPWIDDDRLDVVVAIGDNFWRESVYGRISKRVSDDRLLTLIHPCAVVAHNAQIGMGSILLPGSRVGPCARVGRFAYLNANAVVAHHSKLGDFVSMNSGASLGGRVRVGLRSSLGMNSSVRERCVIGEDVIVGANSFVNTDTPARSIVAGVPARVLRAREIGEPYLR